ncbi:MAG: hypothetical protein AB7K52_00380 [Phycisphaerales bacterium]
MAHRSAAKLLVMGILLAAGGSGCEKLNRGPAISDEYSLEAIAPARNARSFARLEAGESDPPSLAAGTLDRSAWTIRRVVVPAGVTQNRPTYATGPTYAQSTARQRGEYPTIDSALDLGTHESAWSEVYEALAWPFWAGLDVALMPARMIAQPPWETVNSPDWPHERAPGGTASPRMLGDNTAIPVPGLGLRPTVPSLAEDRWIWYQGRWYYWKPGAAEPWVEPPEGAYPPLPLTEPKWVWRDGKWYLWRPGDPEPWERPAQRAPGVEAPVPGVPAPEGEPVHPGAPAPEAAPVAPTPVPTGVRPEPAPERKPRWVFRDGKWVREDAPPAESEPR